jgi:hypothetical protein
VAGYLLFDRAFAYLHVPGTPLYLGECLLAVGLLGVLLAPGYVRKILSKDTTVFLLVSFMAWGLFRSLSGILPYGTNAVRDSALWYYGAFALLLPAAAVANPRLVDRLVRSFSRFLPGLVLWLPFALVIPRVKNVGVHVPGSPVTVLNHKPGNIAVAAAIALAFLWLVPGQRRSSLGRSTLSAIALLTIALDGTQNRGGFGAAAVGVLVALAFLPERAKLAARAALLGVLALSLGLLLGVSIHTGGSGNLGEGRSISGSQLLQNLSSLGGGGTSGSNLAQTVQFRDRLWSAVYHDEITGGKIWYGFGAGPNLAQLAGVNPSTAQNPALELRSPHNSHFDVLARFGILGFALWLLLWTSWFRRMLRSRRLFILSDRPRERGVIEVCIVAASAVLVNAFFDPTLEGAQVACLLWSIFGIGIALSSPAVATSLLRADWGAHSPRRVPASRALLSASRANPVPRRTQVLKDEASR